MVPSEKLLSFEAPLTVCDSYNQKLPQTLSHVTVLFER